MLHLSSQANNLSAVLPANVQLDHQKIVNHVFGSAKAFKTINTWGLGLGNNLQL